MGAYGLKGKLEHWRSQREGVVAGGYVGVSAGNCCDSATSVTISTRAHVMHPLL